MPAYTANAERLRVVCWDNYNQENDVVNLGYGSNITTPCNTRAVKRTHFYKFVNTLLNRDGSNVKL